MSTDTSFDLDAPWELSPSVSLRPERFGALVYDFSTRRLSFLKSRSLLEVVERLEVSSSAREALAAVEPVRQPAHEAALASLAESGTIRRRAAVVGP